MLCSAQLFMKDEDSSCVLRDSHRLPLEPFVSSSFFIGLDIMRRKYYENA